MMSIHNMNSISRSSDSNSRVPCWNFHWSFILSMSLVWMSMILQFQQTRAFTLQTIAVANPRKTLLLQSQSQHPNMSHRSQGKGNGQGHGSVLVLHSSNSDFDSIPQDDMFYDGYDEFIRNLQEDLDNQQFDIYGINSNSNDAIVDVDVDMDMDAKKKKSGSGSYSYNKKQKNRRPRQQYQQQRRSSYRRDPNDDMSISVNEKEVSRLIQLRSKAQQVRNYDLADHLLKELNEGHNVYVWDKDGLWSASPIAPSRRYNARSNSQSRGRGNHSQNNRARGSVSGRGNKGGRQFGRHGHDYIQIGDGIDESTCPLKLHEIHDLIAKRLEFKLIRNFAEADEIQSQLYDNGVRIHDKLKQWRADGGVFADMEGMLSGIISGKPFVMNEHSEAIDDAKELNDIEKLVMARDEARSSSNYDEADRLRGVLWDIHRVAVDDKSRTYSKGGDFGIDGTFFWTDDGPINPRKGRNGRNPTISRDWRVVGGMYTQSPQSQSLKEEDEEEVNNLIHDRLEARRVQDFEVADLILDHLYREYQISVDDHLRQWSVGGEFDESEMKSKQKSSPTAPDGKSNSSYIRTYNRRGGTGELTDKEILLVEAMVARRSEEMARFNKQAASSIRKGLRNKYYVVIDDINCEWHVRGNDFILSPKFEGALPQNVEESRKEIEKLIRERSQARGEGDFLRADEIRSDLLETYNVRMDDRVKEWSVVPVVLGETSDNKTVSTDMDGLENHSSLSKLTVVQLKSMLREAGLPVSGKKAELIKRILQK